MELTHIVYGLLSGILPAVLWLWFWLHEDNLHPEPRGTIVKAFIGGMLAVILVIPLQQYVESNILDQSIKYIFWAGAEELIKFGVAFVIAFHDDILDEPVDAVIYLITVALGFAALENAFFVMTPLSEGNIGATIATGNLRFIGASLVHVVSSAAIGILIAFSFFKGHFARFGAGFIGLILATSLHSAYNLFIIESSVHNTLRTFGFVWLAVIVIMFLFERVKRIQGPARA